MADSRAAAMFSFGMRLKDLARLEISHVSAESRWLVSTREHTNYTFNLSVLGRLYLAAWVSAVTGSSQDACIGWFDEVERDQELRAHISARAQASSRRRTMDSTARYGRRLAWYAIVRSTRPNLIVETGTDKGLGSLVLASALLRNGTGRLITIDVNPEAGTLIGGRWASVVDQVLQPSVIYLGQLSNVDLFIHDSDHSYENEYGEYASVTGGLNPQAIVISDCAHESSALFDWSNRENRSFHFCQELTEASWFPPGGVGLSR